MTKACRCNDESSVKDKRNCRRRTKACKYPPAKPGRKPQPKAPGTAGVAEEAKVEETPVTPVDPLAKGFITRDELPNRGEHPYHKNREREFGKKQKPTPDPEATPEVLQEQYIREHLLVALFSRLTLLTGREIDDEAIIEFNLE